VQPNLERHPRKLLRELGLAPRKAAGQNFLADLHALDRIVEASGVRDGDVVLEVGTGLGRLTARLARRGARVITVEIDRGLHAAAVEHLREFPAVTCLCCDFLAGKHRISTAVTGAVTQACKDAGAPLRVVSNLPYCIGSPAIVNMLEWEVALADMHVLIQLEVADRLLARPGTAAYGPLTVYASYWARTERLFDLPSSAFWPPPDVKSTFLRITPRPGRSRSRGYETFAATVRRLFIARRKTLRRVLRDGWGRAAAGRALADLELSADARPGDLTVAQIEAVADLIGPPEQ